MSRNEAISAAVAPIDGLDGAAPAATVTVLTSTPAAPIVNELPLNGSPESDAEV